MENNDNNKKKILIISIILVLVLIIGVTIAYFMIIKQSDEFEITTRDFNVSFVNNDTITLDNAYPLIEEEIEDLAYSNEFTITNLGTKKVYAKIELTDLSVTDPFKDNLTDLRWGLYEGDTKVTTGTFEDYANDILVLGEVGLDTASTNKNSKSYTLRIWINETSEDQNKMEKGVLTGKISIKAYYTMTNVFASKVLGEDKSNVTTSAPSFSLESTDNGLYVLKDDSKQTDFGFPVYYFKGDVKNNYVSFGNWKSVVTNNIYLGCQEGESCSSTYEENKTVANEGDEIIWRIVRVNEDGSLTLILQNDIDGYTAWSNGGGATDISAADYKTSTIKTKVDEWYENTIKSEEKLDNLVKNTVYCNDKSNSVSKRIESSNPAPTLKCREEDKVKVKAGLITADEVILSGGVYNSGSYDKGNLTYLNNNTGFWTMSNYVINQQSSVSVKAYYLLSNANYFQFSSDEVPVNYYSTRPVITLKSSSIISEGDGSEENPYKLSVQ